MRERWRAELRARARAHWTPERFKATFGDKQMLVTPRAAPELLRALGLMNADATVPPDRVRKLRQTNHLLAIMRPALVELSERFDTVHLLDAGCGRSYLTLLVAWWFEQQEHPVRILGVDRSEDVVQTSRERAEIAGVRSIHFVASELADLHLRDEPLHGVISLHACDTATDDAIALALDHDVPFVAVAPCCQRELSAAWAERLETDPDHPMAPIWRSPHLRRTTAATVTDAFRGLVLEAHGYQVRTTEFVEAHHTPKNTLIRAMKRQDADPTARDRLRRLETATGGVPIGLARRAVH